MAGLTISGTKSTIGMKGIEIVRFLCYDEGRRLDLERVRIIVAWPIPRSNREARGFVRLLVYYRIFIFCFTIIAGPIFGLLRKGDKFVLTEDFQLAMDTLKTAITTVPVLITLDLTLAGLTIYINIDASTKIG